MAPSVLVPAYWQPRATTFPPRCTGLEFDDVFIYGFFRDSAASATEWRAVLDAQDALKEDALLARHCVRERSELD